MAEVSKIKVNGDLLTAVDESVREIGEWSDFIDKDDKVLLKINFNTADEFPASSSLDFIRAVVELVYRAGAKEVIVGASCTFSQNTGKVMQAKGIDDLLEMRPGPKLHNFDDHKWIKRSIKGKHLKHISVPEILDSVDKLIYLPCLKTHFIARYTGALKLTVGLMRPRERLALHFGHVEEKIAEMNTVIKPDLIIMDGRKCFIDKGPMDGPVREPDLILASCSRTDLDIEGIRIIQGYEGNSLSGIRPEELTQIALARELAVE